MLKKLLLITCVMMAFALPVQATDFEEGEFGFVKRQAHPPNQHVCMFPEGAGTIQDFDLETFPGGFKTRYYQIFNGIKVVSANWNICTDNGSGNGNGFTCTNPEFRMDWNVPGINLDALMTSDATESHGAAKGNDGTTMRFTEAPGAPLNCTGIHCPVVAGIIGPNFEWGCGKSPSGMVYSLLPAPGGG